MALQEVKSLISVSKTESRQQAELSAVMWHRTGCKIVFYLLPLLLLLFEPLPPLTVICLLLARLFVTDRSNYPESGSLCKEWPKRFLRQHLQQKLWLCQMIFTTPVESASDEQTLISQSTLVVTPFD